MEAVRVEEGGFVHESKRGAGRSPTLFFLGSELAYLLAYFKHSPCFPKYFEWFPFSGEWAVIYEEEEEEEESRYHHNNK